MIRDDLADWFETLTIILCSLLFIPTFGLSLVLGKVILRRINHWRLYDILLDKKEAGL